MMGLSKTAWAVSMTLHGAMIALLILGPSLRPTVAPPLPPGNVMDAVMIDPSMFDLPPLQEPTGPTPAEIERERLEKERRDEQERIELEAQKQAEQEAREEAQRQADIRAQEEAEAQAEAKRLAELKAEQDAEAEAARQVEIKAQQEAEAKAKQAAELKARQEAEAKAKAEAELKAKQEAEAKAKRESEAKAKREAAEKKAREKAARELRERLAREEQMRIAMGVEDQKNKAIDSGLQAQYIAQIRSKVERSWTRPPSAVEGLSCKVRVSQIPGGDVASVQIVECNGDVVVQRSIENAVYKASPLPEPADPTLFERNLVFIFEPK